MQRTATCLIASLMIAPVLADPPDTVQVRELGAGRYELSVSLAGTADPALGQQAMLPKALELCGGRHPRFGKYLFESRAPSVGSPETSGPVSLQYTQEIECVDKPRPTAVRGSAIPPAPEEPPNAEDEAGIRARTLAYLAAKDTGDFDSAHAMLSPGMAAYMTADSWRRPRAAFNAATGSDAEREVVRITWYDDPAGAPIPGRYAAADYRARYASHAFYCGYVMWLRQQDGGYLIIREEEGQATPDVVAKVAPGQMPAMRMQLGCRD